MKNFLNMKKIFTGLLFSTFFLVPIAEVHASTFGCGSVDGASIFGYDGSHYKFIGAISSEYDSNSIANEYGAGSKYGSDSIMNTYGDFGSKYSSYSAFNDYASSPPILVDSNSNFLGYLTTSNYLVPNINTYTAIGCAKNTFASSDSHMEDVVFKDVPDGTSYSGYTPSAPTAQIKTNEQVKIQEQIQAIQAEKAAIQSKLDQLNDSKLKALQDDIARTQATIDSVKAAMLNPDTALMYSQAQITLNDSPATISTKLAEYQYREEIRIHTNSMALNGYQVILSSMLVGKQEAGLVRWKDSKGNEIIYWKPTATSPTTVAPKSSLKSIFSSPTTKNPIATTSQAATSSTKADLPTQKPHTFWQKVASPFLYLWGRVFK